MRPEREFFLSMQITATIRESKGSPKAVRAAGSIPAVLYGSGLPASQHVAVPALVFSRLYKDAGESTLIDLVVENDATHKVLIQDVQHDPLSDAVTHIDFYQVDMTKKIKTEITLAFTGVAPAVKELGGTLVKIMQTVHVECLPGALVHEIAVDLSSLVNFEAAIHVKDIPVPKDMIIIDRLEDTVAKVDAPRSEEQIEAAAAAVVEDVTAVKVEEKGKIEEEGAEGAAPVGGEAKKEAKKEEKKK